MNKYVFFFLEKSLGQLYFRRCLKLPRKDKRNRLPMRGFQ